MATCQQIASYIAKYPRPSVSTPEFCHIIGNRPSLPVYEKAAVNQDGFVWIVLPKLPVEVVELTESTVIRGALYSDGSIASTGVSIASAVSNVNGPLFASVVAEDMIMTPIDDMTNGTSNQDSPLPVSDEIVYEYPIGQKEDDDVISSPFFDESDDVPQSDMFGSVRRIPSPYFEDKVAPESQMNESGPSPSDMNGPVQWMSSPYFEDRAVPESQMNEFGPASNVAVRRTPATNRYSA